MKSMCGGGDTPLYLLEGIMNNPGWRALAAGIIRQAYKDKDWDFFRTKWCDVLLNYIGINMEGRVVLRMLKRGVDDGKR